MGASAVYRLLRRASGSGNEATDALDDLFSQYEAKIGNIAPTAVGIQLGLMAGLSLVTVLAFSILRPRNKLIYAPKVKYSAEDKRPPKVDDGLLAWIQPLTHTKEPQMLVEMGLDAVIFLRFLRMCRWLFTCVALLCCGVLIPINVIYNVQNVPSGQRNTLSMLTISNVKGNLLWAHVAVSYLICFITFWFIWVNYRRVVDLRRAYFRSTEYANSLHARSIMITGVQRQFQTDQGLLGLLTSLGIPYPTTAVHIGRKVGRLPDLVEEHNQAVRELEQILTSYTKDGKLASKRPTMRIGGFFGCGGKQVDSIEYMTAKIKRLEDHVEQMRDSISDKKSEPYGFASFSAVPYAHVVAKRLQSKKVKGCKFGLAPLPSDIIWKNLAENYKSKALAKTFIFLFLVFFCGLYTIPLVAVAFLANLTAITQYVPFLNTWSNQSSWSFSAVVGIAPPLLSALLQLLLPLLMRALTKRQGLLTHNEVDRAVLGRYFTFLVITQLVIFSLLGVVFNLITELVIEFGKGGDALSIILKEVNKLPARITTTYLSQSSYWLTWLPLRAWAAVFDLAQVLNLVWVWARARLFGRTPREIRDWTKPPAFDYAVYVANSLLVVAVAFVYSPLAPLVAVLAAVAFFASSMIYKYQLLYVSITHVESGGRMWACMVNRILVCLVFQQAILVLTIGLQQGWIRSIACVPPVLLVAVYKIVLHRRFNDAYTWYNPTDQEVAEAIVHRSDARKNRLHKRFGNPALHAELFTPMIHKKSQHLLRQIYSGRMAEDDYIAQYEAQVKEEAPAAGVAELGGLKFKAVPEQELVQSREAYLREQEAWETGSVSTAAAGDGTPLYRGDRTHEYFEAKRREYLASGPSRPQTPGEYELAQVPLHQAAVPGESQDDLLYGMQGRRASRQSLTPQALYPAGYSQAPTGSYDDVGRAYADYGAGYHPYAAPPLATGQYYSTASPAPAYQYPPSADGSPQQRYSPDLPQGAGFVGHHRNASGQDGEGYFNRR